MRVNFLVSRPAIDDLNHIRSWLTNNASARIGAEQIERINSAFRKLREYPRLGHGSSDQLRQKRVGHSPYVIFYRVDGAGVTILRIRHAREDWREVE